MGPGQLALFNLLKAYSLLDPEVGYCQGLSFVAGVLLLHVSFFSAVVRTRAKLIFLLTGGGISSVLSFAALDVSQGSAEAVLTRYGRASNQTVPVVQVAEGSFA